jgi:hypothetical protein
VNRDNTVSFQNLQLQMERVHWRGTLAGCNVMVHQHLDGTISLTHGSHRLGRYSPQGVAITLTPNAAAHAVEKPLRGKVQKPTFHRAWKSRPGRGIPTFPQPRRLLIYFMSQPKKLKPDISLATKSGHFHLLRTVRNGDSFPLSEGLMRPGRKLP